MSLSGFNYPNLQVKMALEQFQHFLMHSYQENYRCEKHCRALYQLPATA